MRLRTLGGGRKGREHPTGEPRTALRAPSAFPSARAPRQRGETQQKSRRESGRFGGIERMQQRKRTPQYVGLEGRSRRAHALLVLRAVRAHVDGWGHTSRGCFFGEGWNKDVCVGKRKREYRAREQVRGVDQGSVARGRSEQRGGSKGHKQAAHNREGGEGKEGRGGARAAHQAEQ